MKEICPKSRRTTRPVRTPKWEAKLSEEQKPSRGPIGGGRLEPAGRHEQKVHCVDGQMGY